jgi:hypothetical protein
MENPPTKGMAGKQLVGDGRHAAKSGSSTGGRSDERFPKHSLLALILPLQHKSYFHISLPAIMPTTPYIPEAPLLLCLESPLPPPPPSDSSHRVNMHASVGVSLHHFFSPMNCNC